MRNKIKKKKLYLIKIILFSIFSVLLISIFFSSISEIQSTANMQFENGLNKWNGRVPPLDLSNVSVCPRETEHRWDELVRPRPLKMYNERRQIDRLPIGEYFRRSFHLAADLARRSIFFFVYPQQITENAISSDFFY